MFINEKRLLITYSITLKVDFQSVEFSERVEILLFAGENVALKLNRQLRLSNFLLSKIPPARKIPLTGNWALTEMLLFYTCSNLDCFFF